MTRASWRVSLLAVCLIYLFVAGACSFKKQYRENGHKYQDISNPKLRKKLAKEGKYLVTVASCGSCHGDDPGDPNSPLSGGRVVTDNGRKLVASNITSDLNTGIGNWSVGEIVRALKASISQGGKKIASGPHLGYSGLSSADLRAIAVYLKSTTAVENDLAENSIQTGKQLLVGSLFPSKVTSKGYTTTPPETRRGEYLANSVSNCKACHTPEERMLGSDKAFSGLDESLLDSVQRLPGAREDFSFPVKGPNVRLKNSQVWDKDSLLKFLSSGAVPGGSVVAKVWCPWPYFANFTAKDKNLLADYLLSLEP